MTLKTRATALLLLAALGAAGAQTAEAPLSKLTPAERDLLLATAGLSSADQFLPGQLAPGLPFGVAPLVGRTVVGTVKRPGMTMVTVRTSLPRDTAQAIAEGLLKKEGWVEQYPRAVRTEVFLSGPATNVQAISPLCKPGVAGQMNVVATALPGNGAQLTYNLYELG